MTDQPPTLGTVADSLGLPPLTPWQQQVADALLRGDVVWMPRQNGRRAIEHVVTAMRAMSLRVPPAALPPSRPVVLGPVCAEGCCVRIFDPELGVASAYARPMFEVLPAHGSLPAEDFHAEDGMRVPASEYDRPDRIFL